MAKTTTVVTAAAAIVAAAGLGIAGMSLANASTTTQGVQASGEAGAPGYGAPGYGMGGFQQNGEGGQSGQQGGQHTTVTGDEATKVTDAVKAKDSAVTVSQVLKDQDGSYDVVGTKSGQPVRVEVSSDLKTITVQTGGFGGHGGMRTPGTAVTGTTLTQVKDAIKAKDSAVTVTQVFKDQDGSYDAMGTKSGQPVHVEVSSDLKTVTVETGMRGHGGPGQDGQQSGQQPGSAPSSAPSASATTSGASV